MLKGQIFFGSEDFIRSIKGSTPEKESVGEVPKSQRFVNRVSLEELFEDCTGKSDRNEKVREAYIRFGYKMKEIADYLSIHYTTVSKIINQAKS